MKKIALKINIFLLALMGIFCLNTCKKLPPAEEFDPSNTRLHVVWSKPIFEEDAYFPEFLPPIITGRYVAAIGRQSYSVAESRNRMFVFDKATGEKHPAWVEGMSDDLGYWVLDFMMGDNKDILFYTTSQALHAYSINSGQCLWTSVYEDRYSPTFNGYPLIFGSDVIVSYCNYAVSSTYYLNLYRCTTGQKTNLFSFDNEILRTMQWAMNEHNDTLFFFADAKRNVCCYNFTNDSIIWKYGSPNTEYSDFTSFQPIVVENKYVVFQNKYHLICVDFSTGKPIWEARAGIMEDNPILYYEGKIIVRPDFGNVTCYDIRTGNLLWTSDLNVGSTNMPSPPSGMVKMAAYKGNLYLLTMRDGMYSNPVYLHCLSLATGAVNWYDQGPDKNIYRGLTIDQETGYLYCYSRTKILCVDLNKTPKK